MHYNSLTESGTSWVADGYNPHSKQNKFIVQEMTDSEFIVKHLEESGRYSGYKPKITVMSQTRPQNRRVRSATFSRVVAVNEAERDIGWVAGSNRVHGMNHPCFPKRPHSAHPKVPNPPRKVQHGSANFEENLPPERPSTVQGFVGESGKSYLRDEIRNSKRRLKSAGSVRTRTTYRPNSSCSIRTPSYFNGSSSQSGDASYYSEIPSGPDFRYFDRHARCHGHNHLHSKLYWHRPQTACSDKGPTCAINNFNKTTRSDRPASAAARLQSSTVSTRRRPKTAPSTVHRGQYPHFCNFVQKLKLSERRPNVKQAFVDPADENDIDGNQPFGDRVQSGVSGRPSSPSSIDEVENANKSKDGFVSMDDLEEVPASDIGGDADDGQTDDTWPTTEVNQEPSEGYTVITDTISGNEGDDGGGKGADKIDEGDDDGPPIRIPTPHDEPPPEVPNDAWNDNTTNSNNDSIDNRPKPKVPDLPDTSALTPSSSNRRSSRGCVKLKEKGSLVRRPSTLPKDIKPPSPLPESVSPRPPTPKTEPEKPKAVPIPEPVKATPKVPDLPDTSQTNRRRESKRGSVISKSAIAFAPKMADPKSEPDQTDDVKVRKYEYNPQDALDTEVKKPKVQPWLQGRLALSQQASRFELPMDMKTLETMKPQEYLKQFCIISTRRNTLYNKMYMKNKDKAGGLTNKGLEKALRDVLVNTITKDDLQLIYKMADILEETTVDYKLFAGIAAMSERVLYPKFVTDETVTIKDHKKEKIECADFCGLNWKFHGVNVNPPVKRILEAL